MNRLFVLITLSLFISCQRTQGEPTTPPEPKQDTELASNNITRSINLFNAASEAYFTSEGLAMRRYYNPLNSYKSSEKGSVWMYTSAIEATNSILQALIDIKDKGEAQLYNEYFTKYKNFLSELIDNLEYYAGTYTLTSYTQTKEWTVYGVNRSNVKGKAAVAGIENVYDDQEWLVRELLHAYQITKEEKYLQKAEYLTAYILDGWDTTLDENNNENGGIVWGPGYYTKHSCSNGPFISPLVVLHHLYKDKNQSIEYRYIDSNKTRKTKTMDKADYYLMYAQKVYAFQKNHLLNKSIGVYYDMLGAKGFAGDNIAYETINGIKYRAHNEEQGPTGEYYSYNSGTMLSGAAELYGATSQQQYLDDMKLLSTNAFRYFAKASTKYPDLYEYPISGFNGWFNCVLMRGWFDVSKHYSNVEVQLNSFQKNLDFAYDKYLTNNLLPANLVCGWNPDMSNNKIEALYTFAYISEYALLASYYLNKK